MVSATASMNVVFAAYDAEMVAALADEVRRHMIQGDSVDLVSGNGTSLVDASVLNGWVRQLAQVTLPSPTHFYAHTAGLANVRTLLEDGSAWFDGILLDYEPGFTDYATCSQNDLVNEFNTFAADVRDRSKKAVAYPSGRGITDDGLGSGCAAWDYAAVLAKVDKLIVQTQDKLKEDPTGLSKWKPALETIGSQMSQYGLKSYAWTPQVTIGGGVNAVTPEEAAVATEYAASQAFREIYVWWDAATEQGVSDLLSFLTALGR